MPTATKKKGAAFQKLSEDATQKKPTNSPNTAKQPQIQNQNQNQKGMNSIASRIVLLFIFPLCVGSLGLGASHFQNTFTSDPNPMNFERDFILPFLMTMVLVVVVSLQTGSFSKYKADPLVHWPKVVKKQKIIRRTVVVDDDGNVIEDEDILKSLQDDNGDGDSDNNGDASSKQKGGKAKKDD
eukprot:405159_1